MKKVILVFGLLIGLSVNMFAGEVIKVGLNADLSSGSAEAGIAIKRGALLAIEEINKAGGVLGKPLQLVEKDHRGIPARGKSNIKKFLKDPDVVAVIGGLHTPVVLTEKKSLFDTNKAKIPYLIPWAAGTPVTNNKWIFRLSVRDAFAGPFLISKAARKGYKKVALLLEQTPWGRGNEKSMGKAIQSKKLKASGVWWFPWKVTEASMAKKLEEIYQSGAQVIMLVANAPEGATIVKQMSLREKNKRLPIISHWGITGGNFPDRLGEKALQAVNLSFLQTYSFLPVSKGAKNKQVVKLAIRMFSDVDKAEDLSSPVGTAHTYDLMYILTKAIRASDSVDRESVRSALEYVKRYNGLIKSYKRPFKKGTGVSHDALDRGDFHLARYEKNGSKWIIRHMK